MRYRAGGEITVFLTLVLSVISAFLMSLFALAQRYAAKSEAAYAMDCAVRSCFAEYNRELFERFHILSIDSSYKTNEGGIDRIEDHFSMYLSNSLTLNELCGVSVSANADDTPDEYKDAITDELTEYMRDNGSPGFDPGNCFRDLEFTATFSSRTTGTYSMTRQYSYDSGRM